MTVLKTSLLLLITGIKLFLVIFLERRDGHFPESKVFENPNRINFPIIFRF